LSVFFVDTSALGRRYLREVGWKWVRRWVPKVAGHIIVISDITTVEMVTTFARLVRDKRITVTQGTALHTKFLADVVNEYLTIPVDTSSLNIARTLGTQYPLRAMDALQLAAARRSRVILRESITFVSGDNRLLSAAIGEGFAVDNPYAHP
jgi:hypothetical protein